MPQPPHSTQPAPPFLLANQTSTSADGSVNGKKCGRIRVRAVRAELGARERVQRSAQMRHGQAAVHRQALDLVEHRRVGGVEFVGAEGAADRDDVDRQLALEQGAHLHRRGVGAQQLPGTLRRDIEGVLFAARRDGRAGS